MKKLSVCIPYKAREHNLGLALGALSAQTLDRDEFEVCIGAMEYSDDFLAQCRRYLDRLDIVSVMSGREFHIPRARNLAMRAATGEVVVQMDADTLLPPHALAELYDHHFAFGQQVCVVGQVVGYGNNEDGDSDEVVALPYRDHLDALEAMRSADDWPHDPRFKTPQAIPWSLAWTGLIALPRSSVHERRLWFDESFRGWGVDDLEWSYRVCKSRLPIVMAADIYALHLPHLRNAAANRITERGNYDRFLTKWPSRDVELAYTIGDLRANQEWIQYCADIRSLSGPETLGVEIEHRDDVVSVRVGVLISADELDDEGRWLRGSADPQITRMPLTGLAVPLPSASVDRLHVSSTALALPPRWAELLMVEARRLVRDGAAIETDE